HPHRAPRLLLIVVFGLQVQAVSGLTGQNSFPKYINNKKSVCRSKFLKASRTCRTLYVSAGTSCLSVRRNGFSTSAKPSSNELRAAQS
ncbi:Tudor domain-containing protein 15, partial [Frankliniella fusca]